jgi:hypothetical protein
MNLSRPSSETLLNSRWLLPGAVAGSIAVGWVVSKWGAMIPVLLLSVPLLLFFLVWVFKSPRTSFIAYIIYCFSLGFIIRHIDTTIPLGLGMEGLLIITWLSVIFHRSAEMTWKRLQTDLCLVALAWFGINALEIANPAGASVVGWFYEMRGITFYWLLVVPLAYMLFYKPEDLRLFLIIIIVASVVAALYGIKQKILGADLMEQKWLDSGPAKTHIIWGRLRVFSLYTDAAQFGASQAHIGLICLILAVGPFIWWKRVLFGLACLLLLYGMLISGTRGAMFVLATGIFIYLVLSKKIKVLILGCLMAAGVFSLLKYTSIGSGNADIARLRTALDPTDPSFQLRLSNQAKLRELLANKPFGEGVGTIGIWGEKFNSDKYVSTIAPDSYYVKIWAEYGVVGFVIWFGIMLFILGKCCGIVWNIRNPQLRQKLLALTAGFGGILVSSYGNEVMNQLPSAMILYISWVFVFLGPQFDSNSTDLLSHE